MNIYNDDTIFLERESTESFFKSLLNDEESYLRREQFISGMEQNVQWDENDAGMEFDIPDIDFSDNERFEPINVIVSTQKIDICHEGFAIVSKYYLGDMLQTYSEASVIKHEWNQLSPKIQWNDVNNQELDNAA